MGVVPSAVLANFYPPSGIILATKLGSQSLLCGEIPSAELWHWNPERRKSLQQSWASELGKSQQRNIEIGRVLSGKNLAAEGWCTYKHAMMQFKLNIRCSIKRIVWEDKTVYAQLLITPNKKILMYILCVSHDHRLDICKHIVPGWVTCTHSLRWALDNT